MDKTYNPEPGKKAPFMGFKKIIDDYENGYKSYLDIKNEKENLDKSIYADKTNKDISRRYDIIISDIKSGDIKFDKEAVTKSIKDMHKKLLNKKLYYINSENKLVISNYYNLLDKYLKILNEKTLSDADINTITSVMDDLIATMIKFDDKNLRLNFDYIKNTKELYMGLLKIVNLAKYINSQSKEGKGLKIITPKQMLSHLPILLSQIHAGNNSTKLKNEIR